uniref:BRD4-interacting chromatin-remodeling complex-associated protein-like isoform X2 n=1 Tax=Myxine glutinosa TaxID=7769 RepID=UPI00358ECE15
MDDEDGRCLLDVIGDPQALNDFLHGPDNPELDNDDLLVGDNAGIFAEIVPLQTPSSPANAVNNGLADRSGNEDPFANTLRFLEDSDDEFETSVSSATPGQPCDILQQSLQEANITQQTLQEATLGQATVIEAAAGLQHSDGSGIDVAGLNATAGQPFSSVPSADGMQLFTSASNADLPGVTQPSSTVSITAPTAITYPSSAGVAAPSIPNLVQQLGLRGVGGAGSIQVVAPPMVALGQPGTVIPGSNQAQALGKAGVAVSSQAQPTTTALMPQLSVYSVTPPVESTISQCATSAVMTVQKSLPLQIPTVNGGSAIFASPAVTATTPQQAGQSNVRTTFVAPSSQAAVGTSTPVTVQRGQTHIQPKPKLVHISPKRHPASISSTSSTSPVSVTSSAVQAASVAAKIQKEAVVPQQVQQQVLPLQQQQQAAAFLQGKSGQGVVLNAQTAQATQALRQPFSLQIVNQPGSIVIQPPGGAAQGQFLLPASGTGQALGNGPIFNAQAAAQILAGQGAVGQFLAGSAAISGQLVATSQGMIPAAGGLIGGPILTTSQGPAQLLAGPIQLHPGQVTFQLPPQPTGQAGPQQAVMATPGVSGSLAVLGCAATTPQAAVAAVATPTLQVATVCTANGIQPPTVAAETVAMLPTGTSQQQQAAATVVTGVPSSCTPQQTSPATPSPVPTQTGGRLTPAGVTTPSHGAGVTNQSGQPCLTPSPDPTQLRYDQNEQKQQQLYQQVLKLQQQKGLASTTLGAPSQVPAASIIAAPVIVGATMSQPTAQAVTHTQFQSMLSTTLVQSTPIGPPMGLTTHTPMPGAQTTTVVVTGAGQPTVPTCPMASAQAPPQAMVQLRLTTEQQHRLQNLILQHRALCALPNPTPQHRLFLQTIQQEQQKIILQGKQQALMQLGGAAGGHPVPALPVPALPASAAPAATPSLPSPGQAHTIILTSAPTPVTQLQLPIMSTQAQSTIRQNQPQQTKTIILAPPGQLSVDGKTLTLGVMNTASIPGKNNAMQLKSAASQVVEVDAQEGQSMSVKRPAPTQLTRESLFLEQIRKDQEAVLQPDYRRPFCSVHDAVSRLLPYHLYRGAVPSQQDFGRVDEEFEAVSTELLHRTQCMLNKYRLLLFEEARAFLSFTYQKFGSQNKGKRESPSAEMVMMDRMFIQEEKAELINDKRLALENPGAYLASFSRMAHSVAVTGSTAPAREPLETEMSITLPSGASGGGGGCGVGGGSGASMECSAMQITPTRIVIKQSGSSSSPDCSSMEKPVRTYVASSSGALKLKIKQGASGGVVIRNTAIKSPSEEPAKTPPPPPTSQAQRAVPQMLPAPVYPMGQLNGSSDYSSLPISARACDTERDSDTFSRSLHDTSVRVLGVIGRPCLPAVFNAVSTISNAGKVNLSSTVTFNSTAVPAHDKEASSTNQEPSGTTFPVMDGGRSNTLGHAFRSGNGVAEVIGRDTGNIVKSEPGERSLERTVRQLPWELPARLRLKVSDEAARMAAAVPAPSLEEDDGEAGFSSDSSQDDGLNEHLQSAINSILDLQRTTAGSPQLSNTRVVQTHHLHKAGAPIHPLPLPQTQTHPVVPPSSKTFGVDFPQFSPGPGPGGNLDSALEEAVNSIIES